MRFRAGKQRRTEPDLDLTPLIDVVFLLLIFFLVTAAFARQERSVVPVDLPDGRTGEASSTAERISLYVRSDGSFVLEAAGEETVADDDPAAIRDRLRALHAADPGTAVFLRGDREVPYGQVMELLDLAREVGFQRIYNVVYTAE